MSMKVMFCNNGCKRPVIIEDKKIIYGEKHYCRYTLNGLHTGIYCKACSDDIFFKCYNFEECSKEYCIDCTFTSCGNAKRNEPLIHFVFHHTTEKFISFCNSCYKQTLK